MSKKVIPIKYTSRDFSTIKQDLIDHAKRYYPETFRDFNEASFGSLLIDTTAYVGDILSFYLDYQVNESFLETAIQYDNVVKIGRQLGYKFRGAPTSHGVVALFVAIPANSNGEPDTNYLPILKKGSTFSSRDGGHYILSQNVNFNDEDNEVVVVENSTGNIPTKFAVRAYGQVISGEFVIETVEVGEFQRFRKVQLPGHDIAEVISVRDNEGHSYFEVEHLSQNTVYVEVANQGVNTDTVKTILKPVVVPRRFVVEHQFGKAFLQFGYGSEDNLQSNLITDPSNVVLDLFGKDYITDTSFDPSKLTKTDKFGIAPVNTELTIVYRINRSGRVNASVGAINATGKKKFVFPSIRQGAILVESEMTSVVASLQVTNETPVLGGVSLPSSEELKTRIYGNYAAQNRAVTKQDYLSIIYAMPPPLGSIKRVNIVQDADSFKRNLNIYVISENVAGRLVETNATIKENLRTHIKRYKMMNDTIDILNAYIVNIGIDFTIIAGRNSNKFDVLDRATRLLISDLLATSRDIGERWYISDVYNILKQAAGVVDVVDVTITNKTGTVYSDTGLRLSDFTDPDGRYIDPPENVILEVKYPNSDIKGTVL